MGGRSKIREHGNVVRLLVGSVPAERVCSARGYSYYRTRAEDVNNPDLSSRVPALGVGLLGAQYFFTFLSRFCSPNHRPLLSGPQAHGRPQEKKSARCCRFESRNDSEFFARNCAFYKPNIALHWSITYHVTNTSLPVRDFSSCRTCIFNIDYFTHL